MDPQSQQVTPPSQPLETPSPPQKNYLPFAIGGFILLTLGFLGAYFFLNYQKSNSQIAQSTSESLTITPSTAVPTSGLTMVTQIPSPTPDPKYAEWTVQQFKNCTGSMLLPPNKEPYYISKKNANPVSSENLDEGGSWVFNTSVVKEDQLFPYYNSVSFVNPHFQGGHYSAGIVTVACAPNTNKYTTKQLFEEYKKPFTDGTYSGLTVANPQIITLWNQQVSHHVESGMKEIPVYLFATSHYIYKVTTMSESKNAFIQQTTKDIFNKLTF